MCTLSSQKKRLLATDKVARNVDKAITTATTGVGGMRGVEGKWRLSHSCGCCAADGVLINGFSPR